MLLESAIQRFRARPLRDLNLLKELGEVQLDEILEEAGAVWHTKPRLHQKVCLVAGLRHPTCYFMVGCGLGKSKCALDILQTRLKQDVQKCLILVPGVANIGAWLDEVRIHAPGLKAVGLSDMTKGQKHHALLGDEQVVITTYMGWLKLIGMKLEKRTNKKGKTLKKRPVVDPFLARTVEGQFQMVVWDEATATKNRNSLSWLAATRLMDTVRYRYALSGTPFSKDPTDLWSQLYLIDGGYSLGETIGLFREAFCHKVQNKFSGWFDFVFDKRKTEELSERIKHASIRYTADECVDLPPVVGGILSKEFMIRAVPFPKENMDHYAQILREMQVKGGAAVIKNVYTRMRQLTAGYIPVMSGGNRKNILFDKNPKLEALLELLEEIPKDAKVIIFTEFLSSGDLVVEALQHKKLPCIRLCSETKSKIVTMRKFQEDEKVHLLVASRSVVFGLNLQIASYIVCFESPDSPIHRTQLEHRIVRMGQRNPVFVYDLVVSNSIDLKILSSLRNGKRLLDELIRADQPAELLTK